MIQKAPKVSWGTAGKPKISPMAYVHKTAVIIGEVVIKDNVIVFPQVVIRADEGFPIVIGENTNIQDGAIIHCLKGNRGTESFHKGSAGSKQRIADRVSQCLKRRPPRAYFCRCYIYHNVS